MRPSIASFFNRFQTHILLFLLLVGSIPLLVAASIMYAQSASLGSGEQTLRVEEAHKVLLDRARQELIAIRGSVKQVANDYAVQRYVNRTANPLEPGEERSLRDYIDGLLGRQLEQNRFIKQLCLGFRETGQTLCSKAGAAGTPASGAVPNAGASASAGQTGQSLLPPAYDPAQKGFIPLPLPSPGSSQLLQYAEPIPHAPAAAEAGTATAVIPIGGLLQGLEDSRHRGELTVYDEQKRLIFATNGASSPESQLQGKEVIRSRSTLDLPEGQWVSTLEVKAVPNAAITGMRNALLWLFVLLGAVSVAGSVWFARHFTLPLHKLRELMKRAELGDLRAYWTDKGMEELNDLGQSYNQMLNRLEDLIKQVKHEESLKKDAEMEALQYQLNPHFLYNTLNTIKWVAKIHKTPQISEVVSALVRLLQASLGKKGDFITIREEAALLRDYMDIQSFRFGDRVELSFHVDELAAGCLVPRMILQPLVENAILHGIEPAKRKGQIVIKAWLDRDMLICQVEDDGVGVASKAAVGDLPGTGLPERRAAKRERLSGLGLSHIRQKIKLYYGPDYSMLINSKPGEGTTVRLQLPIHQSEE